MVSTIARDQGPITVSEDERAALEQLEQLLERRSVGIPTLVGADGSRITLPDSVYRVFRQVIQVLMEGEAVAVAPLQKELTTQQAAELLGVSRPHLIQILERGEISFHKIGTHRRIRFGDLMAYRRQQDRIRRKELTRLTQLSEELDLYEKPRD